jgi:putative transposase
LLREAEKGEQSIEALCRGQGITSQTFYRWRHKYGGVETKDLKRMRELERENSRLKRIVGEQALDIAALKDLTSKKW